MGCKTKVDMFDGITILEVSPIALPPVQRRTRRALKGSERIITNDLKFKKQIIILIFEAVQKFTSLNLYYNNIT